MPGRGDLGFPGAAVVSVLLVLPLIVLVARRRFRIAGAKREEVRRLLRLAAAEAARAEIEATLAYGSGSNPVSSGSGGGEGDGRPQCAVCYSPTTTRCSQCKAVRYCSGRCQILHWRQGHREECRRPPQIDDHCNDTSNVYNLKATEQLCDIGLEIEGKPHALPVERPSSESDVSSNVLSEDDNHGSEPFVDTSGTDSTSDSFEDSSSSLSSSSSSSSSLSSSFSTFSGHLEISHGASASEDQNPTNNANEGESFSHFHDPDSSRAEVDASEMNHTKVACLSANNFSCTGNFDQEASRRKPEEVNCRKSNTFVLSIVSDSCKKAEPYEGSGECLGDTVDSSELPSAVVNLTDSQLCGEGSRRHLDARSHLQVSSNESSQGIPSQLTLTNKNHTYKADPMEVSVQLDLRDSTALGCDKSGHVACGNSTNLLSLNTGGLSSVSSKFSAENTSRNGGSVSCDTSSDMDNAPAILSKSSEGTGSASNGIYDIKTSVRKVVQQFKPSHILRHYPSVFRSDLPEKYKMLFPYDLFIKLYNCDKVDLRPCGLTNCGNSCYANAVLQCLAFTRPLTAYLLQGLHTKTCPKKEWCFTCEFENLLMKAKEGQSPLSPIEILSHIQKIGSNLGYGRQEDAHEFLRYAIDAMQAVCLKEAGADAVSPLAEETTFIQLIFGGYLLSKIKCMKCRGKSERHERMMDLTVEIHGDIGTLEEALSRFTATEILDGENKYRCNRCKSYERAKKKLTILEAPNVLTIALKRFQSGKFGKLNKAVRFPEYLNLAPYMTGTEDKSPVYRLYAVVVHLDVMKSAFSGHYVCYVKSTQKKWYKIDDSKVKPVELERVLSKNAYMLLYARCSPHGPRMIRNSMAHVHVKNKSSRCKDSALSGGDGEGHSFNTRPNPVISRSASSIAHDKSQDHPFWPDHRPGFQPPDFFDGRFLFPKADSSSDSSSLLSCSDAGSWSTESTRNSTSTEEFTEYIFGDSGRFSWNGSFGFSEESDGSTLSSVSRHASEAISNRHNSDLPKSRIWASDFSSSGREDVNNTKGLSYGDRRPRGSKESCFQSNGSPPFLYSDMANQNRRLTKQCSSRETDWVNPCEAKSSVSTRCSSRERTAQTFY